MADPSTGGAAHTFPPVCGFAAEVAVDAGFAAFYETTFPRVYSFLRSQVGSTPEAQELAGRVFLKAYTHWGRAPQGDAAVLWLFRIAKTTLIDYWRVERRREAVRVSLDEIADVVDGAAVDPESMCAAKERKASLVYATSLLDEHNRVLLGLKFTAQHTNREIAAIFGITEAAVSMRLLRALRHLREELSRLGIS
jgi:RNA polymerase sigma-70 factor (ECF subfamily)